MSSRTIALSARDVGLVVDAYLRGKPRCAQHKAPGTVNGLRKDFPQFLVPYCDECAPTGEKLADAEEADTIRAATRLLASL